MMNDEGWINQARAGIVSGGLDLCGEFKYVALLEIRKSYEQLKAARRALHHVSRRPVLPARRGVRRGRVEAARGGRDVRPRADVLRPARLQHRLSRGGAPGRGARARPV